MDCRLLEQGGFSDIQVHAKGKTYELHKVILASRSGFFRDEIAKLNDVSVLSWGMTVTDHSLDDRRPSHRPHLMGPATNRTDHPVLLCSSI